MPNSLQATHKHTESSRMRVRQGQHTSRHGHRRTGNPQVVRALSWNASSLSTVQDELFTWLDEHPHDVVCLQETWWKQDMELRTRGWIGVNCGTATGRRANAGVMILLRLAFIDESSIRYQHVVPGRLLHLRVDTTAGQLDVICLYQHTQAGYAMDETLRASRGEVWWALRKLLGRLPGGSTLLLAGDF